MGIATGHRAPPVSGRPSAPPAAAVPGATPPGGLDEAEVDRRRAAGLGNPPAPATSRTYRAIVAENVFTFVNDVLVVLAVLLALVGRPLDGIVSLAVIATNVVVGVVQEVRAKRTLDRIALLERPTARAVRAGIVREVAPSELVVGDLLDLRAGDQVVLDGTLVEGAVTIDEALLTGESDVVRRLPGDPVLSGTFATGGAGRYVAERVGEASVANRITAGARSFRRVVTPLQREIALVIRVVLAIVILLEGLLVLRGVVRGGAAADLVADATLLAGLVPNGLLVSIAVTYALAAVRLVGHGALVQQANAVESLSHVDVVCLDKTGTITANRLAVEELLPIGRANGTGAGAVAGAGEAIGLLAAAATVRTRSTEALAARWPVPTPRLLAEIPFSPARRWSAVAVERSDGTPVVLVLGAAPALAPALRLDAATTEALRSRAAAWSARGLRVLAVAAAEGGRIDPRAETDDDAAPLPAGLRPVALVGLRDELRHEAEATLRLLAASGVAVRIVSGDDPGTVAALARQAGLGELATASGAAFDELDDEELGELVERTPVLGRVAPAQKERVVAALRARGHRVALIGDGVNDVLALKRADLAIAMGSGSQATRAVADLVLMRDSFAAVARAIVEGQRIRNGMEAILALFLTRITALGLVILGGLAVVAVPIELRNASVLTIVTVGIPATLLAVWAQPGARPRRPLGALLVRVVLPASVLAAVGGLAVFHLVLAAAAPLPLGPGVATGTAATALTTFLVLTGLALIWFVEPPSPWFAVLREPTPDRRPALLAVLLAIGYLAVLALPPARELFQLAAPGPSELAAAAAGAAAWAIVLRSAWRHRLAERFLGIA